MTYTGDVQPGGPADRRDLRGLTVRKMSVSSMANNVYLLTCRATGEQLLVDAADEAPRVLALVTEGSHDVSVETPGSGRALHTVVTTHRHWDHVRALAEVARQSQATTAAGEADADALPVIPDLRLAHGDQVRFGEVVLDVVALRGHTPGSVALAYDDPDGQVHLWTGDSLFPGGVGKTSSPQDFASLVDDVEERVFGVYRDDTWVYPGHGKDTTLGAERPQLQQWRARGW